MWKIVFAGCIMSDKDVREYASAYFLPCLLGSNRLSHKLSAKILRKYGIVSFVLDEKRSMRDVFSLSSRFIPLCDAKEPEIISDELISIAQKYDDALPILIPCSPKYAELLKSQSDALETAFVLCEPDEVFTDSPLADIP